MPAAKKTPAETKKPRKKRTGRPPAKIDFKIVEKLCTLQCTGDEIASFISVSYDTLQRRVVKVYKMSFADFIEQKRGAGKVSLRRVQFAKAIKGDTTMLIWLGKQYLGQKDQHGLTFNDMPAPMEEFLASAKIAGGAGWFAGKPEQPVAEDTSEEDEGEGDA